MFLRLTINLSYRIEIKVLNDSPHWWFFSSDQMEKEEIDHYINQQHHKINSDVLKLNEK